MDEPLQHGSFLPRLVPQRQQEPRQKMNDFSKVPAMIRKSLMLFSIALFAPVLLAQNTEIGFLIGSNEPINDEIGIDADLDITELYVGKVLDEGTWLKIKVGEADLSGESLDEGLAPESDTTLRYALALVGYEFDEIFGTTYLFAGPGVYEFQRAGEDDVQEFGLAAGVGADFPITRQLGIVAELTYHWVNLDEELRSLNVGIGARFRF